jgi:parvulin-like peptidyl-prolyl isomerase
MTKQLSPTAAGLALALALAFGSSPGLPTAAAADSFDATFPDPVVASGKGFEIKRSLLQDFLLNYKSDMAARKQPVPDGALPEVTSNILQHLILNKILVQKATDDEKTKVKVEVAKTIEQYRGSMSEAAFRAELKASGETIEIITDRTIEEQLAKAVIVRELVSSNELSDEAIKQYYDSHQDVFIVPDKVRTAQILIATLDPETHKPLPDDKKKGKERIAKDVAARAQKGEDFGALAIKYSDDWAHTNNGAELPPFSRSLGPEFEALAAAAFTLKTNQISEPVETPYGFHIIKFLGAVPKSAMPLEKIRPEIRAHLIELTVNKKLDDYAAKLKQDYNVKVVAPDGSPSGSKP